MRLRVRALNGHTTEVDGLDPNDTIESVKLRVFHSMQIPPNLQRLIFAGREMQDQLKLIDANLQDNAILHIVVRAQAQRPTTEFTPIEHQVNPRNDITNNREGGGTHDVESLTNTSTLYHHWNVDPQVLKGLKHSRLIKVFAFLDVVVILIAGTSGVQPYIFLAALLPVAGYYGVKAMNQPLMTLYFVYLLCAAVFRLVLFAAAIKGHKANGLVIIFLALGFVVECAIIWFVGRFLLFIRSMTVEQRQQLIEMQAAVPGWNDLND